MLKVEEGKESMRGERERERVRGVYVIYRYTRELPRRTKSRGKRQKAKEDMTGLRHWSKLHRLAWKCVASGGEAYSFFSFSGLVFVLTRERKKERPAKLQLAIVVWLYG